ncbi:DUF7878 domain-containing protein [Actinopolymorpha pittospori]
MLITYVGLRTDDIPGSTLADYLVGIEADLRILDEGRPVYEEPSFPICELARSLNSWVHSGSTVDFVFDSMSFEESGAVIIARREGGWVITSTFTPTVESAVVDWSYVKEAIEGFLSQLRHDLRGVGIDLDHLIGV